MATVLMVDDDADSREILAKFLRLRGHTVTTVPDGYEAMTSLGIVAPDIIVLDYKMPKMDGISFLEVIRCYLRWQALPVILLTAHPEGRHIKRAVELGVKKTFLKSDFSLTELALLVESCAASLGNDDANSHIAMPMN